MMENVDRINAYWKRISTIEARIFDLSRKGVDYSVEVKKRKSLLENVFRLMNIEEERIDKKVVKK